MDRVAGRQREVADVLVALQEPLPRAVSSHDPSGADKAAASCNSQRRHRRRMVLSGRAGRGSGSRGTLARDGGGRSGSTACGRRSARRRGRGPGRGRRRRGRRAGGGPAAEAALVGAVREAGVELGEAVDESGVAGLSGGAVLDQPRAGAGDGLSSRTSCPRASARPASAGAEPSRIVASRAPHRERGRNGTSRSARSWRWQSPDRPPRSRSPEAP